MSLFEDYIDQLWGELQEMTLDEVLEAQNEHQKNPFAGYDDYVSAMADVSHLPESQQESYLQAEFNEFSKAEVDQLFEDRLDEFPQHRLREVMEQVLPEKGKNKKPPKV